MSSEFIDNFTQALNASSPSLSSARLDFDPEGPRIQASAPRIQASAPRIQASATKHALHALLVSFPSSRPLNAQQIHNAISVLSRLGSQYFSLVSDPEEEALKHAVVAKVIVGLYTKALKIYLDQATKAEAEAEWWGDVEHSKLNVAWYLLQSVPSFFSPTKRKLIPAQIQQHQSVSTERLTLSSPPSVLEISA